MQLWSIIFIYVVLKQLIVIIRLMTQQFYFLRLEELIKSETGANYVKNKYVT